MCVSSTRQDRFGFRISVRIHLDDFTVVRMVVENPYTSPDGSKLGFSYAKRACRLGSRLGLHGTQNPFFSAA